jgi:hypothetical protein
MPKWKGWIIEESLESRDVLSQVKIIKSVTERNDQGDKVRIWRLHTVEVDDKDIEKVSQDLASNLREGFYIHFTDFSNMIIIFKGKSFRIRLAERPKEEEYGAVKFKAKPEDLKIWKEALDYGVNRGKVDPRYIVEVD